MSEPGELVRECERLRRQLDVAISALVSASQAGCCDKCKTSFHRAGCATLTAREALDQIERIEKEGRDE